MSKLLLAIALLMPVTGCATLRKACDKVADADDAYAKAMEHLREAGLLDACHAGVELACEAKDAVLEGQRRLHQAYTICFEDSE